eukprot:CAMPEP_0117024264 /NCGR_PEP_ID=MMETSP0472-20121206/18036_1 /TAXON_ID=693140 ORGANISM="Tiarina fusus, Strain LIS" /NCGR_SAMPLE_ID=MMETSP0472 /ASSEMBLY_ACC=CAM_ASM_000603 /LENGTH=336 /DNA_ID=CAMNT_0004730643 /DNA_START=123 /DNA_END=1133 /DNA_ORIENTATION=-
MTSIKHGNEDDAPETAPPLSSSNNNNAIGCCTRFAAELFCCGRNSVSMFATQDPDGRVVDLGKSFHSTTTAATTTTSSRWLLLLLSKFILWGWTVSTYILGVVTYTYPHWFMAYISYWTLAYSVVYMTCSLAVVAFAKRSNQQQPQHRQWLLRATWVMYLVAATHGMMVVLLFWLTEYSGNPVSYFLLMGHGGTFALVVLDGAVINRTPVRLKQYLFVLIFGSLFVGWSIVQAAVPIDNPFRDDEGSQYLYNILDWQDKPAESAIVAAMVLFVAMPVFSILFWGISLWGRRYVVDGDGDDDAVARDVHDHEQQQQQQTSDTEVEMPQTELIDAVQY